MATTSRRPQGHRRPGRRPLLAPVAALAVAAPALLAAAPSAAAPSPSPTKPFVLPRAVSTIGGEALRTGGLHTALPAGVPAPPRPNAAAWLLADLTTGDVLVAGNAHVPLAPASTLKILTALAVVPRLDPKQVYTATDADAAIDGTKVGLVPGSRYTVADLEHGLLMGSGNDTANALATLSGGMPATTTAMAGIAARLQACDTVPLNDSGLDAPGQTSSAYDLALLGRAALAQPRVAGLVRSTIYSFPAAGTAFDARRKRYQIQNHNRLLRNYDGATGVKNGFTDAARGSFVGSATRGGRSYVVTLLRTEGRNWHDAAALLDWAFTYGPKAGAVGRLADPLPPESAGSAGSAATCPAGTPAGDRAGAASADATAGADSTAPPASATPPTPTAGALGRSGGDAPGQGGRATGYARLAGPATIGAGILAVLGAVYLVARRRTRAR